MAKEDELVELDLKDRKLLYALDFDARAPYSLIAKRVRLSKQGVEYRLSSLVKKGVVGGFYPIIHSQKLGYIYCRLLVTLHNADAREREEIYSYLVSHPRVFWLFKMHGPYDIAFMMWCRTLKEFGRHVREFEGRFGKFIKQKKETIATDVVHLQSRFLLGTEETKELHLEETQEKVEIDRIDRAILEELCKDSRLPMVKLASVAGVSPKVASYRLKKMQESGLIMGYRPIINHDRIGYTYYKLFISLSNISAESLAKLRKYIRQQPVVVYWVEGVGLPSDLDIEVMVKDNKELFDFIEGVRLKFPTMVSEYQTVVFMKMLKVKYSPF